MKNSLNTLTVLRNILSDKIFAAFAEAVSGNEESYYRFVSLFYRKQPESGLDFAKYTANLIYRDENVCAKISASGNLPAAQLVKAYMGDIKTIKSALLDIDARDLFVCDVKNTPLFASTKTTVCEWFKTYSTDGYGRFLQNYAFIYENGNLIPSGTDDGISVNSLKGYAAKKKLIADNMENFILGLPYCDMLLYGDMGTGKSSTVRAMVKNYFDKKLRLIEVDRKNLPQIPEIRRLAATFPMKFIIFIDDLSIDGSDEKLSSLKVCLEGSSAVYKNSMVVATSNRRHIVKENFSDRQNAIHESDVLQEQLSLSDRFGLTVMFSSTGKEEYLSIVKQLAADMNVTLEAEKLCELAERWALEKGGRSPRRAKQFADIAYAAQVKGVPIDF